MKTTIQNLAVLILLVSTMNVYSQEYDNRGVRKDYTRPIAGLTIQEIRNAVYGVPAYQEGKTVLSVSNIPVMRDSMEMKKIATTPMLYIDSLIYEHILDAPLLDFQELLLKRFPFLIMQRMRPTEKIMKIMDSLALKKPDITTEEYWRILKRDYADVIKDNFKMYDSKQFIFYPFRKVGDIRAFRMLFHGLSYFSMEKAIDINARPYLEKLKALPPDSLYFVKPQHYIITTQ